MADPLGCGGRLVGRGAAVTSRFSQGRRAATWRRSRGSEIRSLKLIGEGAAFFKVASGRARPPPSFQHSARIEPSDGWVEIVTVGGISRVRAVADKQSERPALRSSKRAIA